MQQGDYTVSFNDVFDDLNYELADSLSVSNFGSPYVNGNLLFRPLTGPTFLGAYLTNTNSVNNLPSSGSMQHFKLEYGFTDPVIASMPAKIVLNFNPLLSLTASSLPPSVSLPGHVEWSFANLTAGTDYIFSNNADTIHCTFSFPPVGDTIESFKIEPRFLPGIVLNTLIDSGFVQSVSNYISHPLPAPSGTTSGVKWMHSFERPSSQFSPPDFGGTIDTAYTDDGYFIIADKQVRDSSIGYNNYVFVSKINKDGLPFWEKSFTKSELNLYGFYASSIKSVSDGGCVVFGSVYDSNTNFMNRIAAFKLDSAGNIIWHHDYSNYNDEFVQNVVNTPDNGLLITGYTFHKVAKHPGINTDSTGNYNLMIAKISAAGDLIWKKEYGGSRDDGGFKVIRLKNGTYLILGATSSNDANVVGSHQHSYTTNMYSADTSFSFESWIINVDANGNMLWNKCYGGSRDGYFVDAVESAGGILMSGFTYSKDGDLPYYPETAVPLWLLQISNTGTINWSKLYKFYAGYKDSNYVYSPIDSEEGPWYYSLSPAKDGNFVIGGSTIDYYGAIKTTHGSGDFSFLKINPSGNIIWQKAIGGTDYEYLYGSLTDRNDDIVFLGGSYSNDDDLYGGKENTYERMVIGKIGITNIIKGQVFVDNNNNGIKDPAELFYSNGRVQSAKIKDTVKGYIFSGQFLNNVDTGNYVTTYIPANNYYTVLPATHNTSFATPDQTDIVNFALKPRPNVNDLEVQLIALTSARPGFENYYRIITKNVGTTTISNAVTSLKKDNRQTFVSSSKPNSGIVADSIWWGPVTLNAFDIDTVDVVLKNAVPTALNNGDTLTLVAVANPVTNDSSAANNRMTVKQIVQGSFDPNDKTEIHGGQLTPLAYSNNEYLQYLIRFQNTGTDTAFFITVKDTFDTKFDLSTIDVLAASHHYNFKLEKNVATWDFKFIKLADSTTNKLESHGYILFKVKPKTGLSVGDAFSNKAAIYFDYNLPVITNAEKTFISDGNGICPGGSIKYTSSVSGANYQWQVNNGSAYTNLSNSTVYSGVNTASLQITGAPASLYAYKFRCLVNGNTYSAESQLKFVVTWTGSASTDWENITNWNCGVLPDANTDVLLKSGIANYPVINNNVSCRSIRASAGASVLVRAGIKLTITGSK